MKLKAAAFSCNTAAVLVVRHACHDVGRAKAPILCNTMNTPHVSPTTVWHGHCNHGGMFRHSVSLATRQCIFVLTEFQTVLGTVTYY